VRLGIPPGQLGLVLTHEDFGGRSYWFWFGLMDLQ
jgi:hypothetical protein